MEIHRGRLEGLLLLTPPRLFRDHRGFFLEAYRENVWSDLGLPPFVQDNHSRSQHGVLRGIHFNLAGGGQGKLVRCPRGRIWDVAVDLRRKSPTFGEWEAFELDDVSHSQLWVPAGFGHGFCVLSDVADVAYKLSSYYDDATELGIRWNDPRVGIAWPIQDPLVSKRDETNPTLEEILPKLPF
jgi:dTDP-4-dehydrorhamnose 3,5-epimerase